MYDARDWVIAHGVRAQRKVCLLLTQTDAKGQTTTNTYDLLGRPVTRTQGGNTTTWTYDTVPYGIGKPAAVQAPAGYREDYAYDPLGRVAGTSTVFDSLTRTVGTSYDSLSRPSVLTYPSGFSVKQVYNANGYLSEVRDGATNALYWQADAALADGAVSALTLGNGLSTLRVYDPLSGHLTALSTGVGTASAVQQLTYQWDLLDNLTRRQDLNQNLTETFTYDALNRLTGATLAGGAAKTYAYDSLGNLTHKSDVGSYTYGTGGVRPHAVTSAGANTYTYDANGNLTAGAGRVITWNAANQATGITQGSASSSFLYGPGGARYKQVKTVSGVTTSTAYIGTLYEEVESGGVTDRKHYIFAGDERIALYSAKTSGQTSLKYLHADHLGSTDTISDASGAVIERLSYDPHGKRRNVNGTPAAGTLSAIHTDRGFTGHEHLDELGLIHMNGRVYDPVLGRFLSADPYIQYPESTQGLNRYSYVDNNPLSLTDPSGLFLGKVFKAIGHAFHSLFKAVGRVLTNPRALLAFAVNFIPIPGMNIALATAIRGFGSGLIAGRGDFRAGVIGAISAGWGRMIGPVGTLKNFVGQTAGGGVFSKLSGGRFSDGLRIGGAIGFAQWSLFQVQTAVAENSGGVGELQGVGVDDKGNATLGAPTRTGTLSVNGVGDFSLRAAVDRVGMTTFDAFIPPSTSSTLR